MLWLSRGWEADGFRLTALQADRHILFLLFTIQLGGCSEGSGNDYRICALDYCLLKWVEEMCLVLGRSKLCKTDHLRVSNESIQVTNTNIVVNIY